MDLTARFAAQDNLSGTIKQMKQAVNDLGNTASTSLDKFTQRFQKIEQSSAPLKRQLRDLKAIMAEMNFKGLSNTEEFSKIAQYAGKVSDAIKDASTATQKFSNDTMTLQAAIGAVQGITGAFTALTGAMNLFGVENDKVKEAILKVQSAMAILNGVQAVANVLNKDSALMLALKALKTNIATASTTANTVAEAANTKAEIANTAAEAANATATNAAAAAKLKDAAAEAVDTGAEIANTAATESATAAQLANNAAVLANPYVLAAAAVVALTAAIVAWISASDDATETTEALNEATEGAIEANKEGYKTFIKMQVELDNVKNKVDNFNGSLEEEKELVDELNDKYGDSLGYYKDLASWKAALADVSYYYCKVLEMEAKLQAIVSRMGEAYADMMAGEGDYDAAKAKYEKYQSLVADAQDDLQAYQFMLKNIINAYGGSVKRPKGGGHGGGHRGSSGSSSRNRSSNSTSHTKRQTEADKQRQTALEALNKELEKYNSLYNNVKDKEGKGKQKALEYENKIIELEKKKLDYLVKGTDEYGNQLKKIQSYYDESSAEFKQYAEEIRGNEIQGLSDKLDGLDLSIDEDYNEALSTIREIISKLREGTDEYEKWQKEFENLFPVEYWEDKIAHLQVKLKTPGVDVSAVNNEIYEAQNKLANVKINLGIEEAPETDYEKRINAYQRWVNDMKRSAAAYENGRDELDKAFKAKNNDLLKQLNDGLITQEEYVQKSEELLTQFAEDVNKLPEVLVYDRPNTSLDNIARHIQDQINDIQKHLDEDDLDIEARLDLEKTKANLKRDLETLTHGELSIPAEIEVEYIVKGSVQDLRASYDNQSNKASKIQEDFEKGIISAKEARQEIAKLNADLINLGMKPIEIEIKTRGQEALEKVQGYFGNFDTVVTSTADSISTLVKSIDEGASAWEIFKNAISATEQIMTAIQTVMEVVNPLIEAHTAKKQADTAATQAQTAANNSETASNIAEAGSEGAKAAGKAASQNAGMGPFGWIAGIAAAVAIAAAIFAIIGQAKGFAGGGIIGGSSYSGDKLFARVNSGEMILNGRQQKNLFNAINKGELSGGDSGSTVSFKIKGSDLYGTLKNYSKIKGKSGVVTGIK